jgi:hypothetical protein
MREAREMKSFGLGLAALVVLVLLPIAPALSATQSTATCFGTWRVSFSPGVGVSSQRATFTTNGQTGTISCVGAVKRSAVTGPGNFGEVGFLEGTMIGATGVATMSLNIPTAAGLASLRIPFTMTTGPGFGFKYSDSFNGALTFLFAPTLGNGITAPVTEIAVVSVFSLKS